MTLTEPQLKYLCDTAIQAALKAGVAISGFDTDNLQVESKVGGESLASQVVTEVDMISQSIILEILEPTCEELDLALLTEESVDNGERLVKDYFWCIDPLDGTLPFVEQSTGYSVSIALVSKCGAPQLGVVYDPVTETLYHAIIGQGLFKNHERWNYDTPADGVGRTLTFVCDRSLIQHPKYDETLQELSALASAIGCDGIEVINHGGAAMNACWVLGNAPACYVKYPKTEAGGGSLWDYAATACLFTEANAVVTDIYGGSLSLNNPDTTFMNERGIIYATGLELSQRFTI